MINDNNEQKQKPQPRDISNDELIDLVYSFAIALRIPAAQFAQVIVIMAGRAMASIKPKEDSDGTTDNSNGKADDGGAEDAADSGAREVRGDNKAPTEVTTESDS